MSSAAVPPEHVRRLPSTTKMLGGRADARELLGERRQALPVQREAAAVEIDSTGSYNRCP